MVVDVDVALSEVFHSIGRTPVVGTRGIAEEVYDMAKRGEMLITSPGRYSNVVVAGLAEAQY